MKVRRSKWRHSVARTSSSQCGWPGRSLRRIASQIAMNFSQSSSSEVFVFRARHSSKERRAATLMREYRMLCRLFSACCSHSITSSCSGLTSGWYSTSPNGRDSTKESGVPSPTSTITCSPSASSSQMRAWPSRISPAGVRTHLGVSSSEKGDEYESGSTTYRCTASTPSQKTHCLPSATWIGSTFSRRWTWRSSRFGSGFFFDFRPDGATAAASAEAAASSGGGGPAGADGGRGTPSANPRSSGGGTATP